MAKLPAFQFYPSDWLNDVELQAAKSSTRGIWINALCRMWHSRTRGEITGTEEILMKLLNCEKQDFELFLSEAICLKFCDVIEYHNGGVSVRFPLGLTESSRSSNGNITLRNRRMFREEKERENNRLRQKRFYDKPKPNGNLTDDITPNLTTHSSSSSSSSSLNNNIYDEIYDFYIELLNPKFKSRSGAIEWIKKRLKVHSNDDLKEAIKNYKSDLNGSEYVKDPRNFFGRDKIYQDFLPGKYMKKESELKYGF